MALDRKHQSAFGQGRRCCPVSGASRRFGTTPASAEGMPRGSKAKYTSKQKRQAHKIETSAKRRGYSSKRAAQIGYATVNKQDHGGKKSGSGRGKAHSNVSSRAGGKASHSGARSTPRPDAPRIAEARAASPARVRRPGDMLGGTHRRSPSRRQAGEIVSLQLRA
jgi:hypothetical protein